VSSAALPVTVVLDASALLTFLHSEPGWERVGVLLPQAVISSVNWSEVVQKALVRGINTSGLRSDVTALGLKIVSFDAEDGEASAELWSKTKSFGLSLGDRACLALGLKLNASIWTADRSWASVGLNADVRLVR
jgi:PIN domain nuclease of toxin-antitoxin system